MCKTRCATWIPPSMALLACSYGQTVVWAPDYVGQQVQVRSGEDPGTKSVTLQLAQCNPNSVAVNGGKLYVICNGDWGNGDKVLVYDAAAIKAAAPDSVLTNQPLQIITSPEFNNLIGIAFDGKNSLWVASNGNGKVLSISEAALTSANPAVTVSLVDSPASPVGLAFAADGSLWVTGLFGGGILLNIPADQLNKGAGAQPRFCMASEDLGAGCQHQDNLFKNPEGVALFDNKIWVANNSTGADGATPGRELVGLIVGNNTLVVSTVFGSSQNKTDPFVCPGGLFATSQYLWVNDESFGEINPGCGAKDDVDSGVGGIFRFTKQLLADKSSDTNKILRFSNITGRPGFGGLFVEDNPGGMTITINVLAGSSLTVGAQVPLVLGGGGLWSLSATVSDDGTLTLPTNQMRFPPIPIMAAGFSYNIQLAPTKDGSGSINPGSGDFSSTLSLRLDISGPLVPAGCRIPEATLALDVRNTGGIPYSSATGTATLVDATFAVPASTGCGIFASLINGQFGLPSASGGNVFKLNVSLDPILTGS